MDDVNHSEGEYTRSICPMTGMSVLSNPDWVVDLPDSQYKAITTIVDGQILKTEIHGYSSRKESRKTAEVLDGLIARYFDAEKGLVQVFDLKKSTGFSLASRRNYIRNLKKRKGILGQIYYNSSLMFNLTLRIGRKLNPMNFSFHIVNNYNEAVNLAKKIISTPPPMRQQLQVDTVHSAVHTFKTNEFCPISGLPVISKPEWTDVDFGGGYSATFKVIGKHILLSDPHGRADYDAFVRFFDLRDRIVDEMFGRDIVFFEIKDYSTARTPSKSQRRLFVDRMDRHDTQILGFVAYNASVGVKFSLNVGKRLINHKQPVIVADTYDQAVLMAISAINYHEKTGEAPPKHFYSSRFDPKANGATFSNHQIDYYVDELLHFLARINWEIDGLDSSMEEIPESHPFSPVFGAITLIKTDLDHVSRERRRVLKALSKSEQLYRLLAENAMDVIWTSDLERNPIYYSPSARYLTGYTMDELMSCPVETHLTPKSKSLFLETLREGLDGFENGGVTNDNVNLLELEHVHKSGRLYWTEVRVSFIKGTGGQNMGLMGVTRDITERKKAEAEAMASSKALQKTQEQLIQAEKMASLGSLVAGVSHEISTPLGISVTTSTFLLKKTKEFERKKNEGQLTEKNINSFMNLALESVTLISNNLGRASELISSFKQVSVDQSNEMKRRFNLCDYTQTILQNLKPKFKGTFHQIHVNCPQGIMVESYPGALSQILTNFVMNSIIHGFEHIPNGEITIRMWETKNHWFIEYSDNGAGMREETLKHVYDPFYTTKRASGGTGLGMHIVYNIVSSKLKGHINCHSYPGEGATFLIQLPH